MLDALAAQYLEDYLSDEDKHAALKRVLAGIDLNQYPQRKVTVEQSVSARTKTDQHSF